MIAVDIADKEEVRGVAKHIWHLVGEDGASYDDFNPVTSYNDGWIKAELDGNVIAVCRVQQRNTKTVEIHPYAAKDFKDMAVDSGAAFLRWLKSKGVLKVLGFVGTCHKPVYNVAKKLGFKEEGLVRASYLKNGKLNDQWVLGVSLDEFEEKS